MKRRVKIAGGIALGALAVAAGLYVNALRIPGESLLKECWAADLIDRASGEKIVGAEDMDFDPVTGTIFISAYDRRAVAREIAAGRVTANGGIYALDVAELSEAAILPVTDLTRELKRENSFLPHGFALRANGAGPALYVINRVYAPQTKDKLHLVAFIEALEWQGSALARAHTLYSTDLCHPNNLAPVGEGFFVTNDRAACGAGPTLWQALTEADRGFVMAFGGSSFSKAVEGLAFPNGIALSANEEDMFVALTRGKSLARFRKEGSQWKFADEWALPAAPDNLTSDGGTLLVAGFPGLLDFLLFTQGWLGVEKSPSAAYRFDPETEALDLLFKDDGALLSGATVALRAGDWLLLGAAWDDHIALCKGMDGIS